MNYLNYFIKNKPLPCLFLLIISFHTSSKENRITFNVPEGFENAEMETGEGIKYLLRYNNKSFSEYVSYDQNIKKLTIKEQITSKEEKKDIEKIKPVINKIKFENCTKGCDLTIDDYIINIDKINQIISIFDKEINYSVPETNFSLVHNQTIDARKSTNGYSSLNMYGEGYVGLPNQFYGYFSSYINAQHYNNNSYSNSDISTFFLQKNLNNTYIRFGKKDSIDQSSNSINSVISPSYDKFITIGSQENFVFNKDTRKTKNLVLYSTIKGNVNIKYNDRIILSQPIDVGRNEISYSSLPYGYYSIDVYYTDNNGNEINHETYLINNIDYDKSEKGNNWHTTIGQSLDKNINLAEFGLSHEFSMVYTNILAIYSNKGDWTSDLNFNRPFYFDNFTIYPTIGIRAGEKRIGGYSNISVNHKNLGSFTLSYYDQNNISDSYDTNSSTSLSYSNSIYNNLLSYSYSKYKGQDFQQIQVSRFMNFNEYYANIAIGLKKQKNFGEGVFANLTLSLPDKQVNINMANYNNDTIYSANYNKSYADSFGRTSYDVNYTHSNNDNDIGLQVSRDGHYGIINGSIDINNSTAQGAIYYNGSLAISKYGINFGRNNPFGSSLLVNIPSVNDIDNPIGFSIDSNPVETGNTLAIPINVYQNIGYLPVLNNNDDIDLQVDVPANIAKSHPGQVYFTKANIDISQIYNGIMRDKNGTPLSGTLNNGEIVYRNGMFSFNSKKILSTIVLLTENKVRYECDLTFKKNNGYECIIK